VRQTLSFETANKLVQINDSPRNEYEKRKTFKVTINSDTDSHSGSDGSPSRKDRTPSPSKKAYIKVEDNLLKDGI